MKHNILNDSETENELRDYRIAYTSGKTVKIKSFNNLDKALSTADILTDFGQKTNCDLLLYQQDKIIKVFDGHNWKKVRNSIYE